MYRTIPTALAVVAVLASAANGQGAPRAGRAEVRDGARMFSPEAVKKAEAVLREVETAGHWQVLIETRDSFGGKPARDVAIDSARKVNLHGLSIAIGKQDHKFAVEPSRSAEAVYGKAELGVVTDLLTRAFKKGDFDAGLLDAVAEIRRAAMKVGVRDGAGLFSAGAVKKADEALEAVRRKTPYGVIIETVATLDGATPADAAAARARALEVRGLYVLIARKEHKFYALPSSSAREAFPREKVRAVDDALAAGFKTNDFDKGLLDAVEAIRRDAEAAPTTAASKTAASKTAAAPAAPAEPASPAVARSRTDTPAAGDAPAPRALPAPSPPRVIPGAGSTNRMVIPFLLVVGGGLLLFLWLISRVFRGAPQQPPGNYGYPANPGPGQGYAPGAGGGYPAQQPGRPGYAPQQGPPGYAPQPPPPGYGPGYAQPGYGPGYAPPQHGGGAAGGFISGALGGAAGAVAGNILYDHLGRPTNAPAHDAAGTFPQHQGGHAPAHDDGGAAAPPPESYDPNAGAGGDWGSNDPAAAAPDQAGVGGDWGDSAPANEPDPGVGGDWGTPDPAPEPDAGGGDWGGGDAGGTDENQGGSW